MAQLTLSGVVLGLREKEFDFVDQLTKERNAGISRRLFLWDPANNEPIEITVRDTDLPVIVSLAEGELVSLNVSPQARGNRVAFKFESVAPSKKAA